MATVADVTQPWLSGQNQIDALLGTFFHWDYQTPEDSAIYYTFSTSEGNQTDGFIVTTDLTSFNAAQEAAARQAIANAAQVTGIQFVGVANGDLADIHFANAHITIPAAAATAGSATYGGELDDPELGFYSADAWVYLDSDEHQPVFQSPAPGRAGYQIILHELGHALGLKHPHEGDVRLSAAEDNTGNTVMSYNWVATPQSEFQEFDVAALQWWYGTDGLGGLSYGGTRTMLVEGTAAAERLTGGAGSDTLRGGAGNDTLIGGAGNDLMDGGAGADSMDGGLGGDSYRVSAGDVIAADPGGIDVAYSDVSWTLGAGLDDLTLTGFANVVGTGNSLDNFLEGNFGNHTLIGGAGNDRLHARGSGDRWLEGGPGNDFILSTFGGDDLFVFREAPGTANADVIFHFASGGVDKVVLDGAAHPNLGAAGEFAAGDARFFAGPGANSGQDPSDRVVYNTLTGELRYDADGSGAGGAQLIARMEPIPTLAASDIMVVSAANPGVVVNGTSGNDTLSGTAGDDTMNGFGGNDLFLAGSTGGNDVIDGGTGRDSIEFKERATSAIVVDFVAGIITGGAPGTISFTNIERVLTGNFNDRLTGNAAGQTLTGQGGSDTIAGAGGVDTLWGAQGADTFIFRETGTANADLISDFASGSDKIVLDASVMTALGASGNFAAGDARFAANSSGTAQDSSDRVMFNTTTKQLFYDADGNGSGAAALIATLQSTATLAATDIVVEGGPTGQVINGRPGNDSLAGGPGDDTINGFDGNDTIDGRGGNDSLRGGGGADSMIGGDGNDTLQGFHDDEFGSESAVDTMDGGLGNDEFWVDNSSDVLSDSGGIDTVHVADMNWTLGAGFENLVIHNDLSESSWIGIGNELNNTMSTTHAGVHLEGRGGNDTLIGGGSERGNQLFGGDGHDSIVGGDDVDTLDGGAGDDTLSGGGSDAFRDTLTGGAGVDSFVISRAAFADDLDLFADFSSGTDKIQLDGRLFAGTGPSGNFAPGDERFYAAPGATAGHDATERVIYNTTTGEVFYDDDGSDAGTAELIAILPALAAIDIVVVNGGGSGVATTGTAADDTLRGSTGDDTLSGLGGNDHLDGGAGNDIVDGGAGNDTVIGGRGRDTLVGGDGNDVLFGSDDDVTPDSLDGGAGNDLYVVRANDVIVSDAGGIDMVEAYDINWTLGTGFEDLRLRSTNASGTVRQVGTGNELGNVLDSSVESSLYGLAGNDLLRVVNGFENILDGGAGNDTLSGAGNAADNFHFTVAPGAANADQVLGFTSSVDEIHLDNTVHAGLGAPGKLAAGDGRFWSSSTGTAHDSDDRVIYNTSTGQLWYDADGTGAGAAQLSATLQGAPTVLATDIVVFGAGGSGGSVINGTSGADTLSGTAGDDTINGFDGNDLFLAGSTGGNDVINGGAGRDSIEFKERATSAITVDFVSGTITGGAPGTISFTSIERVLTGNFNDTLTGNGAGQTLTGQGGSDTIAGAGGVDTLWGAQGADTFVFREMGSANADRINDFTSGSDKLHLDDSAFTAIGAMGNFASGDARFWSSTSGTAHDANDRVIFNTSTGALYYDADGSGAGAAQLIATVQSGGTVAATDIVVI